jgi:hypothetical protein
MSELGDRRRLFTRLLPRLIDKMIEDGFEPMLGRDGLKHMKNSLHYDGLAVDIDLTLNGEYLPTGIEHEPFGIFWEGLDPLCCWGGRFKDSNHYSITMGGRE